MEKLKKRLLGLLVILILVISVLSTVYNVYAVGKEYQLNTQLNNNNLKINKKIKDRCHKTPVFLLYRVDTAYKRKYGGIL